jgi:hypothetical protein
MNSLNIARKEGRKDGRKEGKEVGSHGTHL